MTGAENCCHILLLPSPLAAATEPLLSCATGWLARCRDLHRLPKERVIEWFQTKRREERRGGKGQERQQDDGIDWFDGSDEQ